MNDGARMSLAQFTRRSGPLEAIVMRRRAELIAAGKLRECEDEAPVVAPVKAPVARVAPARKIPPPERKWRKRYRHPIGPKMVAEKPAVLAKPVVERARLNCATSMGPSAKTMDEINAIIKECAEQHGFAAADITGVYRSPKLVAARHAAIRRVAALEQRLSLTTLGKIFKRDHSTISYALRGKKR